MRPQNIARQISRIFSTSNRRVASGDRILQRIDCHFCQSHTSPWIDYKGLCCHDRRGHFTRARMPTSLWR